MKLFDILFILFILFLFCASLNSFQPPLIAQHDPTIHDIWDADLIIVDSSDPYHCLLASSIACYYPFQNNTSIVKPMLVNSGKELQEQHQRFIKSYRTNPIILSIGADLDMQSTTLVYSESASQLSLILASDFPDNSQVIIIPYGQGKNYTDSLRATLISSYLHIPLLIFHDNADQINDYLNHANINEIFIIGDINPDLFEGQQKIILPDEPALSNQLLQIIKQQFHSLEYITITNSKDIQPKQIASTYNDQICIPISHQSITLAGRTMTIKGNPNAEITISIPSGIQNLECVVNYTSNHYQKPIMQSVDPLLECTLRDPNGTVVGYSQSSSVDVGRIFVDTLITNNPGDYIFQINAYHGLKGG